MSDKASNGGSGAVQQDAVDHEVVAGDSDASAKPSAWRIVWDLAWPAIALNSLQVFNGLLDSFFLGRLGDSAVAAHGASMSLTFLLFSIAFAMGTGATALVARFYGARKQDDMERACRQSLMLSLLLGVAVPLIVWLFLPALAALFTRDNPKVEPLVREYMTLFLMGMPAVYVFNVVAASLRAIGDTKRPMYVSGSQILVHMVLNYLLIFPTHQISPMGLTLTLPGAGMGIAGAATAFALSAWYAALVYFPVAGGTVLGPVWKLQMPHFGWMWRILRISIPASIASLIRVISFSAFTLALSWTKNVNEALAALSVGIRCESLAFMPAFGFMLAASTLVGQNLGRKDPKEAERLAWASAHLGAIIMGTGSLVFLLFADQLAGIFVTEPETRASAALFLRLMAVTEPLFGYAMVLTGAMQGAGDSIRPTWVAAISQVGVRIPAVWLWAVVAGGGSPAAWWVMSLTQAINGVLMISLFRRGAWKTQRV